MSSFGLNDAILIERYKYVLEQKRSLNDRTFKVVGLYQVLSTILAGAQFQIILLSSNGGLSKASAVDATRGLFWLFSFVSAVSLMLLVGGVLAWVKYRKDENIIEAAAGCTTRDHPRLLDAIRWYETYIVFSMVGAVFLYSIAINHKIEPLILGM